MHGRDDTDLGLVVRLSPPLLRPRRRADDRPGPATLPGAGTHEGDRLLVRAARRGDGAAWERLVDAYVEPVWGWCRQAAGDARAGAVSELVWLRLAQSLAEVDPAQLAAWLRRAVREEAARVLPHPRGAL